MIRLLSAVCLGLLLSLPASAADGDYTLKVIQKDPPKELKEPVRKEMSTTCYQIFTPAGELHCEFWLRAKVPASFDQEQIDNGLVYKDLDPSLLIGALRVPGTLSDYRMQELAAGVYTLRLAMQPQDGDHMGTSPYPEFVLALAAEKDVDTGLLEVNDIQEKSADAAGTNHPACFLLWPQPKPVAEPAIEKVHEDHWIVKHALNLDVKGKPVKLGFALCVVGHSSAGAAR